MADETIAAVGSMLLIVLVAATVYIVSSNILNEVPDRGKVSNIEKLQINDTETFEQLALYNTLIANKCGDWGGGLPGWEVFKKQNDFSKLKAAGSDLDCKGSEFTAPGAGGALEAGPVRETWRDDQEGRYSRMKFYVPESEEGSNEVNLEAGDFRIYLDNTGLSVTPIAPSEPNRFISGAMDIPGKDNEKTGYYAQLTVIGAKKARDTSTGSYSFLICEESEGYIQTNTGANSNEKGGYSRENPPGVDKEKGGGGVGTDNKLHPFVVITENTCNSNQVPDGVQEGEIINYNESDSGSTAWRGNRLHFGIEDQGGFTDEAGRDNDGGYYLGEEYIDTEDKKILNMYFSNKGDGSVCEIETNDGDWGNNVAQFQEGHMITQEGPIANELDRVELKKSYRLGTAQLKQEYWTGPGGSSSESQLVFSKFDRLEEKQGGEDVDYPRRRKITRKETNLAIERAIFEDSGLLSNKRFTARPEGDMICADYNNRIQWVMCGPEFRSNDEDNKITVDGKTYLCEFSETDYPTTGQASWVLQ